MLGLFIATRAFFSELIACEIARISIVSANSYCWSQPTLELVNSDQLLARNDGTNVQYSMAYQLSFIVLIVQAFLFCLPYSIWRAIEAGIIKNYVTLLSSELARENNCALVASEIKAHTEKISKFVTGFFLYQVLNFAVALGQFFFVRNYMGGESVTSISEFLNVIATKPSERKDLMSMVKQFQLLDHYWILINYLFLQAFPKVVICDYHDYRNSSVQYQGQCILNLNAANEYVFVFVTIWIILALAWIGFGLLVNMILFLNRTLSVYMISQKTVMISLDAEVLKVLPSHVHGKTI